VAQGFKEQQLRTVNIVEEDPNDPVSGVEAHMDFMRFKWRMEGDLRGFERIKQVKPGNKLTLTGNYADIRAMENAVDKGLDYISAGSNTTGLVLTGAGTVSLLVPFPGFRPAGVSLIGWGSTFGAAGSGIDATQNIAKGNYTRAGINTGSIFLSKGSGKVLKRMYSNGNISFHSRKLLEGGSSIGQTYGIGQGKKYLVPKDRASQ
jgi:hypothetical protein